jgi:hypothetical protein
MLSRLASLALLAAMAVGCSDFSNAVAPESSAGYRLVSIDGKAPGVFDLLGFSASGSFSWGFDSTSAGGNYALTDSSLTLTFACKTIKNLPACPAPWTGTVTVRVPEDSTTLDLREANGAGPLRHYVRWFDRGV